jgi:hypothetical protein
MDINIEINKIFKIKYPIRFPRDFKIQKVFYCKIKLINWGYLISTFLITTFLISTFRIGKI